MSRPRTPSHWFALAASIVLQMHGKFLFLLGAPLSRLLSSQNPRFDKEAVAKEGEEGPRPLRFSRNAQNQ